MKDLYNQYPIWQPFEIDIQEQAPINQQKKITGSSVLQSYFLMMKSHMGLAILALPFVSVKSGWIYTMFLVLILGFILQRTLMMLYEVSIKINIETQTFGNISKLYFNKFISNIISFLLIFGSCGTCVSYLIFFRIFTIDILTLLFETYYSDSIIIILSLIVMIPCSFLRTVSRLSSYLKYSVLICAIIMAIDIFYNIIVLISKGFENLNNFWKVENTKETAGLILAIYPYIIFFTIRNSMEEPKKLGQVIKYCNGSSLVIQILISFVHTILYKPNQIKMICLYNIEFYSLRIICVFFYGITLLANLPVTLNSAIQVLEVSLDTGVYNKYYRNEQLPLISYVIRITLVGMIVYIAFVVPSLVKLLASLGLINASLFTILFPIGVHIKEYNLNVSSFRKWEYVIYSIFGLIGLLFGLEVMIFKLFN